MIKKKILDFFKGKFFGIVALIVVVIFGMAACGGDDENNDDVISVAFSNLEALNSPTNYLRLTFDKDVHQEIGGLSRDNITLSGISGIVMGDTSIAGLYYGVSISGTFESGTLTVAVAKSGYSFSPSSRTVSITGSGGGGTLTVTGIPPEYNGKMASANSAGNPTLYGLQDPSSLEGVIISNGTVVLPMWQSTTSGYTRYSGNHTRTLNFVITESDGFSFIADRNFSSVEFSNGSATRTWSQGQ